MQAELRGKLSPESSQEFERLEDLLTDYVFGAFKYLDRRLLLQFLQVAVAGVDWSLEDVDNAAFLFWPQLPGGTEPDVVIAAGRELVIIEAKLHSGFGEDQLRREWRAGRRWAEPRRLRGPHVVAVTANYSEPSEVADANHHVWLTERVRSAVSWVSWQRVAELLEHSDDLDLAIGDRLFIGDLLSAMEKRGVRRVFTGFRQEDYWVVAAGTRIAATAIFPAVATFAEELFEQCAEEGLKRGTPEANRIVTTRSDSLKNPQLWGVTHLNIPLWPDNWPKRAKAIHGLLFVQFPLTEPTLRVGFRIRINSKRKQQWRDHLTEIVAGLSRAPGGYEVAVMSYPDLGTIEERVEPSDLTVSWLDNVVDRAEKYLAVQRTLPLDNLTQTETVRDMLIETQQLIESHVPWLLEEVTVA